MIPAPMPAAALTPKRAGASSSFCEGSSGSAASVERSTSSATIIIHAGAFATSCSANWETRLSCNAAACSA